MRYIIERVGKGEIETKLEENYAEIVKTPNNKFTWRYRYILFMNRIELLKRLELIEDLEEL